MKSESVGDSTANRARRPARVWENCGGCFVEDSTVEEEKVRFLALVVVDLRVRVAKDVKRDCIV
jgi:hypothetical protein